ncbi:Holliday junction resolvase RuvX [bacterium]|nr:Holliday junction resolvase RuvX [bacterium]
MRILAVDIGTVRTGFAISDPLGLTAQPLPTAQGGSPKTNARTIVEIVARYAGETDEKRRVGTVILGNPVMLNGKPGEKSRDSEECARLLREYLKQKIAYPVEVLLRDERLTSVAAERFMIQGEARRDRRKEKKDQVAAQLILENYLESKRHEKQTS